MFKKKHKKEKDSFLLAIKKHNRTTFFKKILNRNKVNI